MPGTFQDKTQKAVKRSGTAVAALHLTGIGLVLLLQVLLARTMGGKEYGIYIYVLNWVYLLVLLGKMGMDTALLRFVPQYLATDQQPPARGIIIRSFQLTAIMACVIAAGLLLAASVLLGGEGKESVRTTFLYGAALLPLISLLRVSQAAIQALKRVAIAQIPEGIFIPAAMMLFVGLGYKAGLFQPSAPLVMAVMVCITVTALLFGQYFVSRIIQPFSRHAETRHETGLWVRTAVPLMLISGMQMLTAYLDTIMVGAMLSPEEAGMYSVAARIAMFAAFALTALNSAVAPLVSARMALRESASVQRLLTQVSAAAFGFAILFFLFMYVWGGQVLAIFSPAFVVAYVPMLILLAAQLFNTGAGSVGMLMNLSGNQNMVAKVTGGTVLLNVTLNFLLIPVMGMAGAALASAVSVIAWNMALVWRARRVSGIDTTILSLWKRNA